MGEEITSYEIPLRLPIIDFSHKDLKRGTHEWDSVKVEVRKALEEFGCFEALIDKFPLELREELHGALNEAFDLPLETKMLNVSEKPYHGYLGVHPERSPLYESFGIDEANVVENVQGLSNILWPQGSATFSKLIQYISEQQLGLERMVRLMILESLGIEEYMEEHMDSNYYLLKLMKYAGPQSTEAKLGLYGHTDKNMMTILYQNNDVNGLEVRTKNGEWILVKPSPNTFTVMIGDSLYAWLNGRLHSPFHRVMMKGNKARYTTALFSILKAGYTVKAPKELVDEQHPLLFKPFTFDEFMKFLHTEAGETSDCALRAFCGVKNIT
ncbi:Oxoglutarate/iron-dependent dioxygenase [Corchorus olitorius]|uniref:Oxoglutarate/iron-dependent dioxygenase n=1 Tax=Corchorus olitorius TaxID=93759 RepID=A0A1R3JZC3_9ROSI|nr:Oxoglutarate/iron-dependent dioxygenase [Corchorus olitorius]